MYAEGSVGVLDLASVPNTINKLAFTSPDGAAANPDYANPDFNMM